MGEIAEMVLEGTLCERCGEFIETEAPGHPRLCAGCRIEVDEAQEPSGIPFAYEEGREAFYRGDNAELNPYDDRDGQHDEWLAGYNDAENGGVG